MSKQGGESFCNVNSTPATEGNDGIRFLKSICVNTLANALDTSNSWIGLNIERD